MEVAQPRRRSARREANERLRGERLAQREAQQ